jgi:hypothetical protein
VGTATRIAGELAHPSLDTLAIRVATFAASLLQVAGLLVFFHTMWSRIRPLGSKAREERGERF